MSDKGETTKKQQQSQTHLQQQQQQQQISSSSPHAEESVEARPIHHQQQQPQPVVVVSGASPFISTPLYVSTGATTGSPFDPASNPKRTRYSGQWKLLPSPSSQQMPMLAGESSPSPSQLQSQSQIQAQAQAQAQTQARAAASSSDTASSDPTQSPVPSSLSPVTGQEANKSEGEQQIHHQFRKGKYVSPVWKPHEMLWLARAWRVQYQGGSEIGSSSRAEHVESGGQARGKTRADKDREVAEFLQRHGVNRDAKTAGTKWDNMLGEFRKVYEWERGGERQHVGKSYFRLSPYERKIHRLPASFDEEVFEELSQFMGSRMRTSHARGIPASSIVAGDESRTRALPPPPPFKEDELPLSGLQ